MRSCVRCKCMYESRDMMGALCPFCAQQLRPTPAQEEKEMGFDVRCKKCDREHSAPSWDTKYCRECAKQTAADLRERWDRAFFAALTGLCANTQIIDTDKVVMEAEKTADLTIRCHAELMASRDAAIAEVVG